jgi:tetratricopeptide (TPR) repeat protein
MNRPAPEAWSPPDDPARVPWNDGPPAGTWSRLLVALLAAAAYIGTVQYQFVWDDLLMLAHSGRLQTLGNLPAFLGADFTTLTGGAIQGRYFRPTLAASLAFDATLWGLRPAAFHLTNILLHAAVTVLVVALVRSLRCGGGIAVIAGILFALHPVHVEAVAWVSARQELLLGLAALGCLLAYRRWTPRGLGNIWGGLALALHGLALLSKEVAIALPLLLTASDLYGPPPNAFRVAVAWRAVALRALPFWGLSLTLAAFRLQALQALAGATLSAAGLWQRVPGALETLARYVLLELVPVHMQPSHALHRPTSVFSPWPMAGLLLALLLPLLVVVWWRRHRPAALGVLWFLVCAVPVLDLVPISAREMGLTDRYLYLPSFGICLALGWWIGRGMVTVADGVGTTKLLAWTALGLLVVGYAWSLVRYLPVWRDEVALYGRMVETTPDSPLAQFNFALALLRAGDASLAKPRLERAIQLDPNVARPKAVLALLLVSEGRTDEGFRLFDAAARAGDGERDFWVSLATAYVVVERWREAAVIAENGLRRFPEDPYLALRRANALERSGRPADADASYRKALELKPDFPEAEDGLARLSIRKGDLHEAERHLLRSLDLRPGRPQPLRELALVREAQGDRSASLQLWRDVLSLAANGATIQEAVDHIRRLEGVGTPAGRPAGKGQQP